MGIFSFFQTQKLAVGLDIGSHAVKVCQIGQRGKGMTIEKIGSALLPPGAVEDGVLQNPQAVGQVIANLIKNLDIKEKKVAISISGYSVIVKKINLAMMSDDELEKHIHSEAEQYIPFDIDEVYLDFQNLKNTREGEDRTDVMLVAAKKDVVNTYLEMLKSIGLTAVVVDVDAFALENAYERNASFDENVVLIDIGASKMNINIISDGTSILARDVAFGSRPLTEQIQSRFNISMDEAEALKLGHDLPKDRVKELEDIFLSTCSQWVAEIKRALDFYYSNHPQKPIAKMILSGGGSRIAGIDRFFTKETDIAVEIFNPFGGLHFDNHKIDPAYLEFVAPEMAISAGLAVRPIDF